MGLSSLPSPSEGVFMILLMNTAQSISIVKEIFRSILQVAGFRLNPPETADGDSAVVPPSQLDLCPSFAEDFRSRIPAMLFKSTLDGCSPDLECIVCLSKFQPNTEINRLNCGHFFHKVCLERWFDYWRTTCPLCRSSLISEDDGGLYNS